MSEVHETKFILPQGHINFYVNIPLLFPAIAQG